VTRALILCDGAIPSPAWARESWTETQTLSTRAGAANLTIRAQNLESRVLTRVQERGADLVRIAAYVYGADQAFSRGGQTDAYGRDWRRHLAFCIPVSDPDFWTQPGVRDALVATLHYLTEDSWDFEFSTAAPEHRQLALGFSETEVLQHPDSVVLFSGGADSLCATVDAVVERHERPILVSHRPAPNLDSRQRKLRAELQIRLPEWSYPQLSFWIHRTGAEARETTQRSRAFLFAALGAAVANELGLLRVFLADNGIVSINLPINWGVVGAMASRSTHPLFLYRFNQLAAAVLPTAPQVINPLAVKTRAETLSVLQWAGCPELLQETLSCSHIRGRPAAKPQCGYCSQCVDRRFGAIAAGMEEHDLAEKYGLDIFADSLPVGEPRTIAESFVRTAQQLREASGDALFLDYSQLGDCILPDDLQPDETGQMIGALIRRHATNVCNVVSLMLRRYSQALSTGQMPADSLLRLVVGSNITAPAAPADMDNVFQFNGSVWVVAYAGSLAHAKDSKGMRYIARLIQANGREISALALERAEATENETAPPDGRTWTTTELEEHGLRVEGVDYRDILVDDQTRRELQAREAELRERIREATENEDEVALDAVRCELEEIERYLQAARSRGGRSRQFTNDAERARKAVSRDIRRALDAVDRVNRELGQHLRRELHVGRMCCYCPASPVSWSL
jgi:7-cyano-7-deazaguanine synthase in queuosine biosynthesis